MSVVQTLPADGDSEGGLLGIAVSPTFAQDGLVFAHYSSACSPCSAGIVIGGAVALGWSRPPGLVAWVVTLALSAYLAVIGGFRFTAATTRSVGIIAVVAVLTVACWAETAVKRRP